MISKARTRIDGTLLGTGLGAFALGMGRVLTGKGGAFTVLSTGLGTALLVAGITRFVRTLRAL